MDEKLIGKFLNKKNIFAVVRASGNPEKYGHQVYRDLKKAGYVDFGCGAKIGIPTRFYRN